LPEEPRPRTRSLPENAARLALFRAGQGLAICDSDVISWDMDKPQREPAKPKETPEGEKKPREIGGPKGPEPTRFGDWERNGRCTDF
jgi:hypothetical protein